MKLPYKDLGDIFDSIDKSSYNWVQQFASAAIEANNAKVLADLKPESLIFPEYHSEAMGCGLEDRGIRDRYEAMQHGWDCAIERCQEVIPDDWYQSDQVSALIQDRDALAARVKELEDVLDGIRRYGYDTLSGRVDGVDDRNWQRDGVREMTRRAAGALTKTLKATP